MTSTYSRDNLAALRTDDNDLTTAFASPGDYNAVASLDGTTVDQSGTLGYAVFNFKDTALGNSGTFTWKGQSTKAPSESVVKLQIYKRTGAGAPVWEDVAGASDNSTAADTNFTITGTVSDLTNYKAETTDLIVVRAWQAASGGTEITGLAQEGSLTWTTAWDNEAQTGDSAWDTYNFANENWRVRLEAARVTQSGTLIRLGFHKTTQDYILTSGYINGDANNFGDFSGAPTAIFTTDLTITSAGATVQYSGSASYTLTSGVVKIVSFHIKSDSTLVPYLDDADSTVSYWRKTGADESSATTWTGVTSETSVACLAVVQVGSLTYPNTYSADLTGTVTSVEETDTETTLTEISYQGSLAATLAAVEADAGSYYHDSGANKIYIHASSGAATGHTYEWS